MSVQGLNARQQMSPPGSALQGLRQLKPIHFFFALLTVLGSIHALSMLSIETYRSLTSTSEIKRLSTDVNVLQAEIDELAAIAAHANDEVYLEHLARCYGFAYADEVRFVTMVDVKDQPATGTVLCR